MNTSEQTLLEPNIIIALRLDRAAAAIDVSPCYLRSAIKAGRLKAVRKFMPGKPRGVILIMVEELRRFAALDEGVTDDAV